MREDKLSDITILSAYDVDTNLLLDFYNTVYPGREINNSWQWLYRSSFFGNKIPLVIIQNGRVIAHAGMIPFNILYEGIYYTASWFIDFDVLPEFQRKGLGILLTEKWMDFSDICFAFGNEKSMGIFKKYGWIESSDTFYHYYLLSFNLSKFVGFIPNFPRKILGKASRFFYNKIYHKYASSVNNLRFDNLDPDSIEKFMASFKKPESGVVPIRDSDYISWRLFNSPDRDKYYVFSINGVNDLSIIIKLCNNQRSKYIDLLWISDPSKYSEIRCLISTLARWGINEYYSYIRYYTSNKELSSYFSRFLRPIIKHPRFASYTKDIALLTRLKNSNWNWELIDSDFEWF